MEEHNEKSQKFTPNKAMVITLFAISFIILIIALVLGTRAIISFFY